MMVAPPSKKHAKARDIVTSYAKSLIPEIGFDEVSKYYKGTADLTGAPQEVIDAYPLFMEYMEEIHEAEKMFGCEY